MAIVEDQIIEIEWHHLNKEWFIDKGYIFTKYGDRIAVGLQELKRGSKVQVQTICDNCGDEFTQKYNVVSNRENHFCKRNCYYEFINKNGSPNNTQVEVMCQNCEKPFKVKKHRYDALLKGEQEFITCSRACQNQYMGKEKRGENNKNFKECLIKSCETCNNKFEVKPHRKNTAKYCSVKCQRIGVGKQNIPQKKKPFICDTCGETSERWEHEFIRYEYHFCSNKCRREFQGVFVSMQQQKKEDTEIQIIINELLARKNIEFEQEKPFYYYAVDNYLSSSNLIIEVMGDYWHSNPKTYQSYSELNKMQKNRVKIDKSKKSTILKKNEINILYLWEHDIKTNIFLCEKLIDLYIKKSGKLKDYNSFNYVLENGNLKVKDQIDMPYFMKANTKRQVV